MGIYRSESDGSINEGDTNQGSPKTTSGLEWDSVFDIKMEPVKLEPRRISEGSNGVTLAWQDLSVYVPKDSEKSGFFGKKKASTPRRPFKRVINDVTGIVYPGNMVAIMGASGAGKTTLMNALANKAGKTALDGEIRVNGMPVGKFMNQISGFVHQQDLFLGSLTVAEHLYFMARMKLDRRLASYERQRRVDELMSELNLNNCADVKIGIPGLIQGISGGERKRLAFASEVITDPPLLFCDEPTTGLDSFSAQKLVTIMKNMAARGKTVLCTIHQPSSHVFSMFDQLLLLAEGRTAYMGTAVGGLSFMKELGFTCPETFNPADFYIRTLAVNPVAEEESKYQIRTICDAWAISPAGKDISKKASKEIKNVDYLESLMSSSTDSLSDQTILGFNTRRPNWLSQTYWLTWRNFLHSVRNPRIHAIRTVQKIIIALLIGVCYLGVDLNQMGIQAIQGVLFVFISENTFRNMYGIINVFPSELPLFKRETQGGLYRCDSYYISKVTSMTPGFILEPLLFACIAYWMVGLRPTADAFLYTCVILLFTANVAAAAGCFFSAAFETTLMAITCLVPFDYILMLTAGIFINVGTLPSYISWSKFISWFSYAYEALTIAQWSNITEIQCEGPPGTPCIPDGAGVIASKSFSEDHFTMDFIGMVSLYFAFHALGYLALLRRSKQA